MKKPCKIRTLSGSTKKGIVAKDLCDLIKRGCHLLEIAKEDFQKICEEDKTEIIDNEYFESLPANTTFVFLECGEEFPADFSVFLKTLEGMLQHNEAANEMKSFLKNTDLCHMYNVIASVSATWATNNEETRDSDPDWFKGIDNRFKTKSDVMRNRAKNRIRGYLDTAKTYFNAKDKKTKQHATEVLKQFEMDLRKNNYFGSLFDRTAVNQVNGLQTPLCNEDGWFGCGGIYNEKSCRYHHNINPYSSRQFFVIFSTWNLDHIIEKSRQVLPDLESALISSSKHRTVNSAYFFSLLFTTRNLKLVHIVCHDKGAHKARNTDKSHWYLSL
ncbi:DNA fragmentation factor subunit beta-like [Anneissia japonica]|uniref:DNA fragmentation factor subunit beta-like n=1 Tax=Anneissia japonica TaxID=1529436 RepID=UPI001425B10A|nr:DNA fragmentation factor subunit beta-like [Anneissia japonica]